MGEAEPKFLPVEDAVQCLLRSFEVRAAAALAAQVVAFNHSHPDPVPIAVAVAVQKASVSPALITEMEDVLSTIVALSIRAGEVGAHCGPAAAAT